MKRRKVSRDMIHRSFHAFRAKETGESAILRKPPEPTHHDEDFHVGDAVISTCGTISGVILSISDGDALITWECRGKTIEHLADLSHTEFRISSISATGQMDDMHVDRK